MAGNELLTRAERLKYVGTALSEHARLLYGSA